MKDPVKQVRDNQFALARLLERTPEWPIKKPFMSHGPAFPLSSVHQFSLGPGPDPAIIIDRNDMSDLPVALERLLAFHRGARDRRRPLGAEGVEALVDLLAPSVTIRVPLGEQWWCCVGWRTSRRSRSTSSCTSGSRGQRRTAWRWRRLEVTAAPGAS